VVGKWSLTLAQTSTAFPSTSHIDLLAASRVVVVVVVVVVVAVEYHPLFMLFFLRRLYEYIGVF
jgi:hypothetical protein